MVVISAESVAPIICHTKPMLDFTIRSEKVSDIDNIHALVKKAFERSEEADLINKLRDDGALLFSLLACDNKTGKILGHLAVSPAVIENETDLKTKSWQVMAIAPLSVLPEAQKQGIGKALMNYWLKEYADPIYNAVVLLGDPQYYKQFGFVCAANHEIILPGEHSEQAFQIHEIRKDFLTKASGRVYYHSAFINV